MVTRFLIKILVRIRGAKDVRLTHIKIRLGMYLSRQKYTCRDSLEGFSSRNWVRHSYIWLVTIEVCRKIIQIVKFSHSIKKKNVKFS